MLSKIIYVRKDDINIAKKDEQILKETKYCKIFRVAVIEDDEYNSCIERIEVKEKKRE